LLRRIVDLHCERRNSAATADQAHGHAHDPGRHQGLARQCDHAAALGSLAEEHCNVADERLPAARQQRGIGAQVSAEGSLAGVYLHLDVGQPAVGVGYRPAPGADEPLGHEHRAFCG